MTKELFRYDYNGMQFVVDDISLDQENWLISKQEDYIPDKSLFIYNEFIKAYPDIDINNYYLDEKGELTSEIDYDSSSKMIYSLASRSRKINEWLSTINIEYARSVNIPTYFKEKISSKTYEEVTKVITETNKIESARARKLQEAAIKYKNDVDKINKDHDIEINKKISSSRDIEIPIKILNLNTTYLPLSLQIAIEKYTPATASSPNRNQYAREVLVNFKCSLIEFYNQNKNKFDIDKLIDSMSTK